MVTELILSVGLLTSTNVPAIDALVVEEYRQANTDVFGFSTLEIKEEDILSDKELLDKLDTLEANEF